MEVKRRRRLKVDALSTNKVGDLTRRQLVFGHDQPNRGADRRHMVRLEVLVGSVLNRLRDGLILAGYEDRVVDSDAGPVARPVL